MYDVIGIESVFENDLELRTRVQCRGPIRRGPIFNGAGTIEVGREPLMRVGRLELWRKRVS